jgi:hypothetical protein
VVARVYTFITFAFGVLVAVEFSLMRYCSVINVTSIFMKIMNGHSIGEKFIKRNIVLCITWIKRIWNTSSSTKNFNKKINKFLSGGSSMKNSSIDWLAWQKLVIREEYKDIKKITPARNKAQRQFDRTVNESLPKVMRYVR